VQKASVWSKLVEKLDNIDPMPWHQAILVAVAFFLLMAMAIFGDYASL
jgi:hypothetical protein